MKRPLLLCLLCGYAVAAAHGQSTMDTIGLTALLALDPTLTGSGVIAMQPESTGGGNQNGGDYEVDPGSPGQPISLFTYRSAAGSSGTFPNIVGTESTHADQVAEDFYGMYTGVAPALQHVNNYESGFFYTTVIQALQPVTALVFNQSFESGDHNAAEDQVYDNYIAKYHTVIASGVGNGGAILTPSDCYNGLGVAAYGGASSTGPSVDGRCKPDITAPADFTSFSTPLVSGAAAILIQGGRRLGVNATAAIDSRTVKALLLNGAVKPSGWTHTATAPLDPIYGAGILNIFNSYADLAAGRHAPVSSVLSRVKGHPPLTGGRAIAAEKGWDYHAIPSNSSAQGLNHYRLTTSGAGALIATLVWNKGYKSKAINRLGLYLYDSTHALLASSTSPVDNVQHIYLTGLTPGTYELEVLKIAGPVRAAGVVSYSETYALAWDFDR